MTDFNNKQVIITGGANGIGRALAKALGRAGASIIIADINDELGVQTVDAINADGGKASYQHVDVTDYSQMQNLITNAGAIDFIFNNAGISVAGDARDITVEHWQKVTDVNYWGVVYGTKLAYDVMAQAGRGHIINIASLAGLLPFPTNLPYSATKHAVVGLSMSLRSEARDLGVNVTVVCPGFIESNIYQAAEMVNAPKLDVAKNIPFKLVDTDVAAAKILDGVARNKAMIVFPAYGRLFWWLNRLHHGLTNRFSLQTIRDFRKLRGKQ